MPLLSDKLPIATPTVKLNNGHSIPLVGLGCWMGEAVKDAAGNEEAQKMTKSAIDIGYRHIDTASGYGNEEGVGKAIRESGVPRGNIFVTTKLPPTKATQVREAFDESFERLNVEYIDLYLVHWPQVCDPKTGDTLRPDEKPTISDVWAEMEKLLDTGKVRSIGVSNFSPKTLNQLLSTAKVVPAVNQIQLHPYMPNTETVELCKSKGIHVTAYSPLGQYNSPILKDGVVTELAKKHNATPGQIALSWAVQDGISVVPKSANPERQKQNLQVLRLASDEVKQLDSLHKEVGKHKNLCAYPALKDGKLFGWDIKTELGWDPKLFSD